MKKALLLVAVMLFAICSFADTNYNSFNGYNPYWHPFGYPNTATYGETFIAPSNGDNYLQSFSFYMAGPYSSGDIVLSAYIATWTGTGAGTLLWTSAPVDYPNTGNAELAFNTGGLQLTAGANYIAFISVSQYYGQSSGLAYISGGDGGCPGCAFAYYNNGGDFGSLFTNSWDAYGYQPDFAFSANFTAGSTPEPGTLVLLGTGLLGAVGAIRRKRNW